AAATPAASEEAFHRVIAAGPAAVVAGLLRAGPRPRRLVYLSSYAACGPARGGRARRVDEPPAPLTAYGRTKLAGEAAAHAAEAHGVEVAVVRAPAVYGPGDRAFLPLFRLAKRALAPAPTGPPRRVHLIFVEDLARAVLRAADAPPGTYAVAEPVEHLAAEVPREIGRALGRRVHRLPVPAAAFRAAGAVAERVGPLLGAKGVFSREKAEEILAEAWVCDLAGSGELLAPHEATPLAEGMRRTAAWYRDQGWI
ncbi:MAG TPA: NAD-dependent epimerase/dehydratase family protein, partial [Longimicrobiaceae bacterium]|nr:NAD-dependent epimerase/dehydratase family protein [Longimicrobiaceae bacterium]